MTFIMWGGIVFAVVGSIGVSASLLTGVVPTKWPDRAVTSTSDPGAFRARVRTYAMIAAVGAAVAALGGVAHLIDGAWPL
jgi:hypothetical protein